MLLAPPAEPAPFPLRLTMSFRRTGHSDERRRRVLMDDGSAPAEATPPAKRTRDKNAKTRNYSDAALANQQAPVTAVIPTRPWTLSVMLLSATTLVVLLNLLHAESYRLASLIGTEQIAPLTFQAAGNLSIWLSGLLLAWSAVMGVQIFNLRRHRIDDYKGRYRVWLWTTAVLVLASIDAVSGLHLIVGGVIAKFSGPARALNVDLCWLVVGATIVTFVALRMGIEMRRSIGALVTLVLALACYGTAAALKLDWLKLPSELALQALTATLLTAHTLIWFTTLIYARYVYLDAQGLMVPRPPREKKVKKPKETEAAKTDDKSAEKPADKTIAGKQVRIDAAHNEEPAKTSTAAKPATAKPTTPPAPAATGGPLKAAMISTATNKSPQAASAPASNSNAATSDPRKLSKAERKRLRRQGNDDDGDEDD